MLVDMPIHALEVYQGINPCPKDHGAYWTSALEEMKATQPDVTITEADFKTSFCTCYDLYFTGVHGARVYAKLLVPKGAEHAPAVLHFHGYSGASSSWTYYLPYAAEGFVVAALDCRGQAGRSEDVGGTIGNTLHGHIIRGLDGPADHLLFRDIFLDTAQLAGIVMDLPYVDETNVGAWGGSQGGGLTLACAALEPRVKAAAPSFPFLCDYQRVWEMDLAIDAYAELKEYFRSFDPRHEHEKEIFTKLGYIDLQYLAPRIRAKVLMFTGLMDTICPPSTQYAAYNKMTCPKQHILYPDFGHEDLPDNEDMVFAFLCKELK